MNPDKFLTDLAFISRCDAVSVYYNQFSPYDECFEVQFFTDNCMIVGTGPTVEAAMQDARAKLAEHYA